MFTFPHSRTALLKPPTVSSASVPWLLDTSHQRGKHAVSLCSAAVSLAASVFCSFPVKLRRVSSFPWVGGLSPCCLQIPQWGLCPHALWHGNSSRSMFSGHFWPPSLLTFLLLTPVITLLQFHNLHLLPRMSESWFSSWLAGLSPSPFPVPHHRGLLFLEWPRA